MQSRTHLRRPPRSGADGVQFDHYIAEMRKPNSWGGQVELQAASIRYRCARSIDPEPVSQDLLPPIVA